MAVPLEALQAAFADRYRIERELGHGGMAIVYLAHDRKHDRKVALKVLRPELAAALGPERFVQEIKTTASLQHPQSMCTIIRMPVPATTRPKFRSLRWTDRP